MQCRMSAGDPSMKIAALVTLAALSLLNVPAAPPKAAAVRLWRIDCGTIETRDFGLYSDTGDYDGKPHRLVASCYLIQHGSDYLLWDTGLSGSLVGHPLTEDGETASLDATIVTQLARAGIRPEQIRMIGISHRHFDHVGQARDFPGATLLIGKPDYEQLTRSKDEGARSGVMPWLTGGAKVDAVEGDRDLFGDGSVTMLFLPGHTPGHHALLVRLGGGRIILLSGDQFHAQASMDRNLVPRFNADRAQTLQSSVRFREIAAREHATVVIQHEPADTGKVPALTKAR